MRQQQQKHKQLNAYTRIEKNAYTRTEYEQTNVSDLKRCFYKKKQRKNRKIQQGKIKNRRIHNRIFANEHNTLISQTFSKFREEKKNSHTQILPFTSLRRLMVLLLSMTKNGRPCQKMHGNWKKINGFFMLITSDYLI